MSEKGKKCLRMILTWILFAESMFLVVAGQRDVGPEGVGKMIVGLLGLIVLIGIYNKKYQ